VSFAARQLLDMWSPSNFPFTNPEVLRRAVETGGENFRQGVANWQEARLRWSRRGPPRIESNRLTRIKEVAALEEDSVLSMMAATPQKETSHEQHEYKRLGSFSPARA